ncbi:MAG TPA: GNAT family N-acetyltransferase [Clostridiaceae bacterium]|nr:GNAT family N-acetyltransferase [Clostridiaceae bacterium]
MTVNKYDCFTIRKAIKDDAEAILNITRESFIKYVKDSGLTVAIEALTESLDDIVNDIDKKDVYILLVNKKPVGSIRVEILQDGSAYISRFGVLPEYQNLGIGKSLLEHVENALKTRGVKKIVLHTASKNKDLICFYYSRGFYVDSTTKERGYIRALMVKELE